MNMTPNQSFHMYVGFCITAWALIEEQLFKICTFSLATSAGQAAIVYYRTPSLDARLSLVSELVTNMLPQKERPNGGREHPAVIRWNELSKNVRDLLTIRRRIAHHPVSARHTLDKKDGIGELDLKTWLEIYMSQEEQLRGRDKNLKPLKEDHLTIHYLDVAGLSRKLGAFYSDVLVKQPQPHPLQSRPQSPAPNSKTDRKAKPQRPRRS
jgi:hypothetical protein